MARQRAKHGAATPGRRKVNGFEGPYPFRLFVTVFGWLLSNAFFSGGVFPILRVGTYSAGLSVGLLVAFWGAWLASGALGLKVMRRDPRDFGLASRAVPSAEAEAWCPTCSLEVLSNSRHCWICNKCILGFDHHCPWLNNCVGSENYRAFFASLWALLVLLSILLAGAGLGIAVLYSSAPAEDSSSRWPTDADADALRGLEGNAATGLLGFGMALFAPAWLAGAGLLCFHSFLCAHGLTTYEYITGWEPGASNARHARNFNAEDAGSGGNDSDCEIVSVPSCGSSGNSSPKHLELPTASGAKSQNLCDPATGAASSDERNAGSDSSPLAPAVVLPTPSAGLWPASALSPLKVTPETEVPQESPREAPRAQEPKTEETRSPEPVPATRRGRSLSPLPQAAEPPTMAQVQARAPSQRGGSVPAVLSSRALTAAAQESRALWTQERPQLQTRQALPPLQSSQHQPALVRPRTIRAHEVQCALQTSAQPRFQGLLQAPTDASPHSPGRRQLARSGLRPQFVHGGLPLPGFDRDGQRPGTETAEETSVGTETQAEADSP